VGRHWLVNQLILQLELRARGECEATQFDEIEDELYPSLDGVKTFDISDRLKLNAAANHRGRRHQWP
jgi:hypothetical protein